MIDSEFMNPALIDSADNKYDDFRNIVLYSNRFLADHPFLKSIENCQKDFAEIITPDVPLFRARRYDDEKKYLGKLPINGDHDGYTCENMFPRKDLENIKDGRANPKFIRYLYVAREDRTAIVEIRPLLTSYVCLSEFRTKENLRILDFSATHYEHSEETDMLYHYIGLIFSVPCERDSEWYIPSQCVTSFIKALGYDGIGFYSALNNNGRNIAFFYPEKLACISLDNYVINKITYDIGNVRKGAKPITPAY